MGDEGVENYTRPKVDAGVFVWLRAEAENQKPADVGGGRVTEEVNALLERLAWKGGQKKGKTRVRRKGEQQYIANNKQQQLKTAVKNSSSILRANNNSKQRLFPSLGLLALLMESLSSKRSGSCSTVRRLINHVR